jgi:hypothetical protein
MKSAMAFGLLCLIFNFSAFAQTNLDKPMDAKSLAPLVRELGEVVSKNTPDEKDAALITEKWNARQNLIGKKKSAVIDLLFEDVRSVIKDSGVRYQIYSIFSFYKQIPNEPPSAQIQKDNAAIQKPAAVNKLVDLTYRMHPYVGVEEQLASLPGTKDVKTATEEDRKNRIEGFDAALKVNNKLTADQKSFVRANYDQLIKIADKITEDAINKNFPTERWIKEGLQKSYSAKFTSSELDSLIVYFQGADGQPVLKYIRISQMAQLITGNGGTLNFTEADKAEHDKFAATPLGKKFISAYITEAEAYEKRKEEFVRTKIPDADGFAIYEPANLNKLFNKFVADNYKK